MHELTVPPDSMPDDAGQIAGEAAGWQLLQKLQLR